MELFRKTLVHFFDWLSHEFPERLSILRLDTRKWYAKTQEGGWFGKIDKDKAKQLLADLADKVYEAVRTFGKDKQIAAAEPYQLVARLFTEHCKVKKDTGNNDDGDSGAGSTGDDSPEKLEVRKAPESPGSSLQSPYDPDAGCGYKVPGYLVHVTETCNNESAEIITDYDVTPAGETDRGKDAGVIDRLIKSGVQPNVLYEDGGYPTAQSLIDATGKGTRLITPMSNGRLPEGTIGRDQFQFDESGMRCLKCPCGHAPIRHGLRTTGKNLPPTMHAYFDGAACRACALRPKCIVRKPNNSKKGSFHLEIGAHLIARDTNLTEQTDDRWWDGYKIRSGVEATMSELKRGHGMGKLRVRRMPRVRLAVSLKIMACNVKRWLRAADNAGGTAGVPCCNTAALIFACQALLRHSKLFECLIWLTRVSLVA
ncbi:MAG: transposase [Deltaproteobacteria bacterium]|nr:transposase [Deltaproteobacteria bacterium]MBN2671342.1 transposase [Deltaproteobacteria bacterium]